MESVYGTIIMKNIFLVIIHFFLLTGCVKQEMENIDGFSFWVVNEDMTNLGQLSFRVKIKERYRVQIRLDKVSDIEIGNKVYNTYFILDRNKVLLFDLLHSTSIIFLDKNQKKYIANRESIIKYNKSDTNLYGNISITEKYLFVTLAYFDLERGNYLLDSFYFNEELSKYNPRLIIGVGQSGTF
jgi:hypothetical protein